MREWDDISADEWKGMTLRQKVQWMKRASLNCTHTEGYRIAGAPESEFSHLARKYNIRFLKRPPETHINDRNTAIEMANREFIAEQARDMGPPEMERASGETVQVGEHLVWRRRFSERFREDYQRLARFRRYVACAQELAALLRDSPLGYDEIINLPREPMFHADAVGPRESYITSPAALAADRII